jgi:hypothetical protein
MCDGTKTSNMTLPFRAMANEVGVIGFVEEAVQPFLASAESITDSQFDIACAGLLSSAREGRSVVFRRVAISSRSRRA